MNDFKITEGIVHFSGIGGIGMSGLAEILYSLGYKVQGSDISPNDNCTKLENLGIKIFYTQKKENIKNVNLLVRSSAIKNSNEEIIYAKDKNIKILSRADILAIIMSHKKSISIAGTHGKTTTTSMLANIFSQSNLDPSVVSGGIMQNSNTNAFLGHGEYLIAEADESDRSFLKLPSFAAIVTNIEPEHLESYGDFDNLKNSFVEFCNKIDEKGCIILCNEDEGCRGIKDRINRKVITYGFKNSDLTASNIRYETSYCKFDIKFFNQEIKDITLNMPGSHNVLNCLATIAVSLELGVSEENIRNSVKEFKGVKRRFTEILNDKIRIIDDYAHHPTEIKATLKSANQVKKGKIYAIFQPHRYSRVKDHYKEFINCFQLADYVFVSPIYAAGEKAIDGISNKNIAKDLTNNNKQANYFEDFDQLVNLVNSKVQKDDMLLFMGAGSITKWAYEMPQYIKIEHVNES